jgi:putative transposase
MARRPRVILPEIPLHIIQRGNNQSACFYSDEEYIFYIDKLDLIAELADQLMREAAEARVRY